MPKWQVFLFWFFYPNMCMGKTVHNFKSPKVSRTVYSSVKQQLSGQLKYDMLT